MKKRISRRFVAIVTLMIAFAIIVFVASPGIEARGGCNKNPCPSPPEGCTFAGCDAAGNCVYNCCPDLDCR